jgi:beta-lactamase regulating signal transducer with metallopeptidase domain
MNAALNRLGSELFGLLGQLSVELAALAVFVLLAGRVLRIKSPALRHFLWLVVLLKPIVAVTISSPWIVFTPLISSLESSILGYAPSIAVMPIINSSTPSLTFASGVAALWLLGAALLMGRILIGYGVIWRLRHQARVHHAGPLFDALQKARLALDLISRAEVATSYAIRSPIVLGILKPLIVVPADLLGRLHADELEMVLMHELAHVRRYDNLTLFIQRLTTVALFFHPVVWLCGRMLQREAEQACDDLVVYVTGRSEDYACGLTSIAELAQLKTHLKRRIPIMNVFAAAESDLALRIRRALGGRAHRMGTGSRLLAAILLCAMAGLTLPASGIADGRDDGVDWDTVKTTAPETWSEQLKEQIAAAGHDVDAIAERVRHHLSGEETRDKDGREERIWRAAMATDPDEWSDELKAAILELKPDSSLEEIAEGVRKRRQAARIWRAAMATDPDEWSDRLKAALLELKPDSTLEEIAEEVRKRQQDAADKAERGRDDGVDWDTVKSTAPETWSDELKGQIVAAGYEVEAIAERVRQGQAAARDKTDPDLEDIGRRIRAAVERGDMTPEEGRKKMEAIRQQAGDKENDNAKLREFQRGVVAIALAAAPEDWSDELKAAVVRAGWDLAEFTEGIRQRQQSKSDSSDPVSSLLELQTDANSAVEERSWGKVKSEVVNPE